MAPHFLHRTQSSQSHRSLTAIIASSISRAGSPDNSNITLLSSAKAIEEETLPKYSPRTFYAAKIGERLNNRYEVVAKLGYGMTATVWLAKDLHSSPGPNSRKYVTIKINVNTLTDDFLKGRSQIAKKLMMTNPKHPGYSHVRFMLEAFTLKGKHGDHLCIVYDVLREPIDECRDKYLGGAFSSTKLRVLLPALLQGLDYMHSECHVVHTDLKADNIMMGLGNDPNGVLERFAQHQHLHPAPRKPPDHHDGHIIYQSCSDLLLVGDKDNGKSMSDAVLASAKITDIGLAEWGDRGLQHKAIQSNAFTCPEVLLGVGWSYPADIWNLGVMLWDLIESHGLFDHIKTQPGQYKAEEHLALMIALLGMPPNDYLDRGLKTSKYFTWDKENKEWVFNNQKKLKEFKNVMSWDSAVTHMQGDNKASFIDFAKKMIAWVPEERWTAKQLLEHPWLQSRPGSVTCACQDFEKAHRSLSVGKEKDAQTEKDTESEKGKGKGSSAASIASTSAQSDSPDCFPKPTSKTPPRDQSPPKHSISQTTTNSSYISMESVKDRLPSLVVTPSR